MTPPCPGQLKLWLLRRATQSTRYRRAALSTVASPSGVASPSRVASSLPSSSRTPRRAGHLARARIRGSGHRLASFSPRHEPHETAHSPNARLPWRRPGIMSDPKPDQPDGLPPVFWSVTRRRRFSVPDLTCYGERGEHSQSNDHQPHQQGQRPTLCDAQRSRLLSGSIMIPAPLDSERLLARRAGTSPCEANRRVKFKLLSLSG